MGRQFVFEPSAENRKRIFQVWQAGRGSSGQVWVSNIQAKSRQTMSSVQIAVKKCTPGVGHAKKRGCWFCVSKLSLECRTRVILDIGEEVGGECRSDLEERGGRGRG